MLNRIIFHDLKEDKNLNDLSFEEQQLIWVPSIVFVDTESRFITINDEKAFAIINREGKHTR